MELDTNYKHHLIYKNGDYFKFKTTKSYRKFCLTMNRQIQQRISYIDRLEKSYEIRNDGTIVKRYISHYDTGRQTNCTT